MEEAHEQLRERIARNLANGEPPLAEVKLTGDDLRWILDHPQLLGASVPTPGRKGSIDFRRALLDYARLHEVKVPGINLEGASARVVELSQADVSDANLVRADLDEADLTGTDLYRANLEGAFFGSALLDDANLLEARGEGVLMPGVRARQAIIAQVNMPRIVLRRARLDFARLDAGTFTGGDFREAVLAGASLRRANLSDTNFAGANFSGADLSYADLSGADCSGADFSGADLSGVKFARTDLRNAILDPRTRLDRTNLANARLCGVHWGDANLAVLAWNPDGKVKQLGDEREARERRAGNGEKKPRAQRLEEFAEAISANRRLALALREQGLHTQADQFAYRAHILQRALYRRRRRFRRYTFSRFLDAVSGYGYRPLRTVGIYCLTIVGFALIYFAIGRVLMPPIAPDEAFVFSVTAFHGREPSTVGVKLGDPLLNVAAAEAVTGLLIEISFIATFTQRFFGR